MVVTTGHGEATGAMNAGACSRSAPPFHSRLGKRTCVQNISPAARRAEVARPTRRLRLDPFSTSICRSGRFANCSSRRAAYTPVPALSRPARRLSQATLSVFIPSMGGYKLSVRVRGCLARDHQDHVVDVNNSGICKTHDRCSNWCQIFSLTDRLLSVPLIILWSLQDVPPRCGDC